MLACTVLLSSTTALAFTTLSGGKALVAKEHFIPKKDILKFTYKDPAIGPLVNPTCAGANASSLQVLTSNSAHASVALPCGNWKAAGSGYSYKAALGGPGGIRTIKYKGGILKAKIQSGDYSLDPVTGPVSWVETRFTVGAEQYCGRWETPPSLFKKNLVNNIKINGTTTVCQEICGNAVTETGEDCDDGNAVDGDGCDTNCTVTACGNGIQATGEACDDGNLVNGDGCSDACLLEVCGDDILNAGEDCDDGGTVSGDCCDALCGFEPNGSGCTDDANLCTDDVCDGAGTCTNAPNTDPCDDSNGCTVNDACSGGACGGDFLQPWVNEFDYDSNDGFPNTDRDEFVEIAGPAGLDLAGYQVVSVEGAGGGCLTPSFINAGDAHFVATIPGGSVLADDTGTGIGFFVVCFTDTSTHVSDCDVTLPGSASDSNLKNGHLTNTDSSCPDGFLLLDNLNGYVDAVGYEGIVQNTGTYGGFFHIDAPYSAERDEGFLEQVSIYKNSSSLSRASSASEWTDPSELGALVCSGQMGLFCPTNTDSPGTTNPGQSMTCGSACMAFLDKPAGLLD
ncbi:MAG: DUF4215 domain-containing protein [Candidatus Binatia bacterium]|nr:DUF4215 domain-containing protein [Candidatus Binatia bacterium]